MNCPKETLWNSQIHFVDRLLNKFTIGNGGARVSVVKYSSDTREVVSLDEHLPKDQIMDKLRHTTYAGHHPNMHKGKTNTFHSIIKKSCEYSASGRI